MSLRGAVDQMPPTFVCGNIDCGRAFQVERCPQCSQPLHNHDSAESLLICEQGHRFQKYNSENARSLTVHRPCAHVDDCICVNFLFRPYIFLEQLDFDLRALNELLTTTTQQSTAAEQGLTFDSKADSEDRKREILLLRLNALLGIAEGVLFMHDRGCLHADIAPENTMVRLGTSSDGKSLNAASVNAKLIDFGLAKRVEDNRTSTTVVGRITFLAPEQMVAQGTLGPRVTIRFVTGSLEKANYAASACSVATSCHLNDVTSSET